MNLNQVKYKEQLLTMKLGDYGIILKWRHTNFLILYTLYHENAYTIALTQNGHHFVKTILILD